MMAFIAKSSFVSRMIQWAWIAFICITAAPAFAQIPAGAIAYWHLDETTAGSYTDMINGHDASCSGTCPSLKSDGAVDGMGAQTFDGSTTALLAPFSTEFDWAAGDSFTIEGWLNRGSNGFSGNEVAVGRYHSAGPMMWSVGVDGSGHVVFQLTSTTSQNVTLTSTKVLSYTHSTITAMWHHFAAVKDGDTISLYLDGESPVNQSETFTGGFSSADAGISIGRLEAGGGEQYFKGAVDEVAIYDQALSPERISGHYFLARGYDRTVDDPVRIMPMGDSITADSAPEATRAQGDWFTGYRRPLWDDLMASGYPVAFAGSEPFGDFASPAFGYANAGFPGVTTMQLYDDVILLGLNPVDIDLLTFPPPGYDTVGDIYTTYTQQRTSANGIPYFSEFPTDVILLHIGTNGISSGTMTENLNALGDILDHVDSVDERITVILAKIINHRDEVYAPIVTYNAQIDLLAQQRTAEGDKVIVVDQESALTYPDDMSDNLHPNMTGYGKMAGVWAAALDTFLPVGYTIDPSINGNGTIDPAVQTWVEQGDGQRFSFLPDVGHHVSDLKIDSVSVGSPEQYLFSNVMADHTIQVSFAVNLYSLRFTSGSDGALSGATNQTLAYGSNSTAVQAIPNDGYNFSGWTGDYAGSQNPLVIQSVTSDMNIQANFSKTAVDPDPDPDPSSGSSGGGGGCFISTLTP